MVTVAPLPITYSWHGTIYPVGCTSVPESLAIALGVVPKSGTPGAQNALGLINSAEHAAQLEVLPGIGPANASRIFQARPKEGYEGIEAVALVPDLSNAIDWDVIEAWESE
ncbi:MAG: hypothetical protein AAGI45_13480 [Cyanobacteria bacterium P01_H01_bin.26]